MTELVELRAGDATAAIAIVGAEARMWRVAGRDLLWRSDPAIWAETAPLLFPVVGWTRGGVVRVGSATYPLGLHGFARKECFRVSHRGRAEVALVLEDNATTRALYPFGFRLEVAYRLEPDRLTLQASVANSGTGALPYAFGAHPGFAWPFAGGEPDRYELTFEKDEVPLVPEITANGLFAAGRRSVPMRGRRLPLTPELFAQEALCFLYAHSRRLRFCAPDGSAIEVATENMPHIALWSRPAGRFLAIESWTGHGDPEGFGGDLFDKPSMQRLDPGASARHEVSYRWIRASRG